MLRAVIATKCDATGFGRRHSIAHEAWSQGCKLKGMAELCHQEWDFRPD